MPAETQPKLPLPKSWSTTIKTPNEVYFHRDAANEQPRFEPRPKWPRGSPCAKPQVPVNGEPGVRLTLNVA